MSEMYDAIIIGAGPAGLSVGSELSKTLKILIIEKGEQLETTKSWFVPLDVVEKNPDILPYTQGGVTRFLADTYSGATLNFEAKLFPRYPFVMEEDIQPYWKKVIQNNGAKLLMGTSYKDHTVESDSVTVDTSGGTFVGKLLIDASGSDSPILEKYKIVNNNYYWWSVYGAKGKHPGGIEKPLQVGDYMLWQTFRDTNPDHPDASLRSGRPVFEYEIIDNDTSFTLLLFLMKKKISKASMKTEYMHMIRNEATTKPFHNIELIEEKFGWYPSGGISQKISKDRVAFIGDSGCWTTPCGWGMGFILNNYAEYAKSLGELISKDKLDADSLNSEVTFPLYDRYQTILNELATHFLSNASAPQLDAFIEIFKPDGMGLICEKMFTLKITYEEVLTFLKAIIKKIPLVELAKILPPEDHKLMVQFAALAAEEALADKAYELFHRGKKPSRDDGDGYEFGK